MALGVSPARGDAHADGMRVGVPDQARLSAETAQANRLRRRPRAGRRGAPPPQDNRQPTPGPA